MNFLFTKYVYPISKEVVISKRLNLVLDNPRTFDEIDTVRKHLEKSLNNVDAVYEEYYAFRIPIYLTPETEGILTLESALDDFYKNYASCDEYVKIFYNDNIDAHPLDLLARMWIIARYDDEGQYNLLKEEAVMARKRNVKTLVVLSDKNPIVLHSEALVNYCYLLSLMFHTDESLYYGATFLINHNSYEVERPKLNRWINKAVAYFGILAHSNTINHIQDKWESFYHIRESINLISEKLDNVIDDSNLEKVLYISNLLKVIGNEINDARYKLVTLVSIIELLLTHSPDHNRFNVEESISKQFRLKAALLIYQNDKEKDLECVKDRLKDIYNQRSNIAHGNFKSLDSFLKKKLRELKDEDKDEESVLGYMITYVYNFLRAIIEKYVKDRKLIDFLKEN